MIECYLGLGHKQEAREVAAVLCHNYPNSDWYNDAYSLMKNMVPEALQ